MMEWWELLYGIPSHYRPVTRRSRMVPGANVKILNPPVGIARDAVPIGSVGKIERLGDGDYDGGFFVTVFDTLLKADLTFFFEYEDLELIDAADLVPHGDGI